MENNKFTNKQELLDENIEKVQNLQAEMLGIEDDIQKIMDEKDEKYKRLFAEFDNFKKRTQKEKELSYTIAKANMLESLFPVIDAMDSTKDLDTKDESFKQGIELIREQLNVFLEKNEIIAIGTVGESFNPEYHMAIQMLPSEQYPSNTVINVYRKGYQIGNKVIRHAMVIVAQ